MSHPTVRRIQGAVNSHRVARSGCALCRGSQVRWSPTASAAAACGRQCNRRLCAALRHAALKACRSEKLGRATSAVSRGRRARAAASGLSSWSRGIVGTSPFFIVSASVAPPPPRHAPHQSFGQLRRKCHRTAPSARHCGMRRVSSCRLCALSARVPDAFLPMHCWSSVCICLLCSMMRKT